MTKNDLIEAQLKLLTLFDSNNSIMTVKQCSLFLNSSEDTVRRSIKSGSIIAYYDESWKIPKIQFHKELIENWGLSDHLNDIYSSKQHERPNKKTYLMVEKTTNYVKIGTSINPNKREHTLQSQKPDIELYAVSNLDVEKILHDKFKSVRIRGEWFKLSKDDIDSIINKHGFEKVR